jgi:phospholipid/cholesterol/gamma-HCH transport system substrate-binding protein
MAMVADAPRGTAGHRLTEDELLTALPARSMNREVRVGLFVLLGLVAFFAALFTFTDVGTFRGRYYLNTVVENAGGMRRGDPVQMRGVNIGRVVGFDMVPQGVGVRMELYGEYEVPEGSQAQVQTGGLLGGTVVNIVPGNSAEELDDGATIPGSTATGLLDQAGELGTQADVVLGRVNALLNQQTVGAVGQSAVELQALLGELNQLAAQQRGELAQLSSSLRRSAAGVEAATTGPELQRSIQNVDALTARLDQATQSLSQASTSLNTVLGRLERGEGTLGKLSTDEQLYTNLNSAAVNLNALIADIQANPKKYIELKVF